MPRVLDHRRHSILVAVVLFAAIVLARATIGGSGDAITFLFVVPVVLVATSLGFRAGLLAGAIAFVLSTIVLELADESTTALGNFNRGAVFIFVGGLIGRFADNLRALEAESGRHFNLSLDMICTLGFDGRFRTVNPAFKQTLGYEEEQLVGHHLLEFIHPEDIEKTEEEGNALFDGITTVQFQNRYLDKAGEVHWLEWAAVPIPDEELIYGVARDITDRRDLVSELERLSQRDFLTGLYNRRRFDEELERQLEHTRRYGTEGALLLLDLDHFKEINDVRGHAAGDEVLCSVAEALTGTLRSTDTAGGFAARIGGDEFAVLLPEADAGGAQVVADRLIATIADRGLRLAGENSGVGVSIGISLFDQAACPPADALLAAADRAMYAAKSDGGGAAGLAVAKG